VIILTALVGFLAWLPISQGGERLDLSPEQCQELYQGWQDGILLDANQLFTVSDIIIWQANNGNGYTLFDEANAWLMRIEYCYLKGWWQKLTSRQIAKFGLRATLSCEDFPEDQRQTILDKLRTIEGKFG